jgi:hypothetical protein
LYRAPEPKNKKSWKLTLALTLKIAENKEVKRKKHSLSERSEFRMLRATTRSF